MSWWKKIWILRKQNDIVKIMLLFLGAGIFFLARALCMGVQLYQLVQSPIEYALLSNTGENNSARLEEIDRLEWVSAASPFQETTVSFELSEKELTFSCVALSEDYVTKTYGITKEGAMKTFYANAMVYEQLKTAAGIRDNPQVSELRLRYQSMQQNPQAEIRQGTAKVIPLKPDAVSEDLSKEPFICCIAEPGELGKPGSGLWILGQQDLDGENVKQLTNAGGTLQNSHTIQMHQQQYTLQLAEIKYSFLIALICGSVPFFLHSAMKMKYDK